MAHLSRKANGCCSPRPPAKGRARRIGRFTLPGAVALGVALALWVLFLPGTAAGQADDDPGYRAYLPLVIYDPPSAAGLDGPLLIPGQPQEGIVGADTRERIYAVEIEPGQMVSLQLESSTPADAADLNLFVYAPGSTVEDLALFYYWAVSSNYGNNEAVNMIMPDPGRWFVVVRADAGTAGYRLSATVRPLENTDAARTLTVGEAVSGELSLDNLVDVYRVTAGANQRLTAIVDFGYELEVALYPPGVTDIYTASPRARSFTYWTPFAASAASLDAGDWYVVVRSYLGSLTNYQLSVFNESAENVGTALPLEERIPRSGTLGLENMADLYTIDGREGDILGVTVSTEGGYLAPRIYSPAVADVNVAQPRRALEPWDYEYDSSLDAVRYRMNYLLDADGAWLVEVATSPYDLYFDIDYEIAATVGTITDTVRAMPLTPGKIQHGYVDPSGENDPLGDRYDVYAVHVTAGQRLHLELTSEADEQSLAIYPPGTFDFFDADFWQFRYTYTPGALLLLDTVLPEDGTWYVVVRFENYGSGEVYYTLNSTLSDVGAVEDAVMIEAGDVISDRIAGGDLFRLYALEARQGEQIEADLTGDGGDADLYLFPPETRWILRDDYVALSAGATVEETLTYAVPDTGLWYLAVVSYARLTGGDEETDFTLAVDVHNQGVNGASVMGGMVETIRPILPPPPK